MYNDDKTITMYSTQDFAKQSIQNIPIYSWIPTDSIARLKNYIYLSAFYWNKSSNFREIVPEIPLVEDGTAHLIVETMIQAIIGNNINIDINDLINEQGIADKTRENQLIMFKEWQRKEMLKSIILKGERNASMLGDAVYKLRWDNTKKRVRIQSFNPGFFFPVIDEYEDLIGFYFAWEEKVDKDKTIVVKEHYWLENEKCYCTAEICDKKKNESLEDLKRLEIINNQEGVPVENLDLGIDFLPVIYIANIETDDAIFGISDLSYVLRLLSQIADANTDLTRNLELLGGAAVLATGFTDREEKTVNIEPGKIFLGPQGSTYSIMDTSSMNNALLQTLEILYNKIYVNSRVTNLATGALKGNEIPSGIALKLMQHPLDSLIRMKRINRKEKYSKLLKFVQKFYNIFGTSKEKFENLDIDIGFGSIFPIDQTHTIEIVTQAVMGGVMSIKTAIEILRNSGIDVADDELERIKEEQEATSLNLTGFEKNA